MGIFKKFGIADVGVAVYILAAFVFLIVPIPSGLLDVCLAINMSIAFVVLFNTMFAKEVLDMSFFPTVLLFTTIFRISLNVSSTRLILTTGQPGNVVETFGQYVGGGDLVIGAIVFIILKLIGKIDWSWWWVLSPLWITFMLCMMIFILMIIVIDIMKK